jgi:transcriptional regulator with XRE-family HTH domain
LSTWTVLFSNMGTRKVELGAVGQAVRYHVRRLREREQLSLQGLSERLTRVGRPILPSGLSKIEQGDRRVDVDDLVALAHALHTAPNDLLRVPNEPEARNEFGLTPEEHEAGVWAAGQILRNMLRRIDDDTGLTDNLSVTKDE